MEIDWHLESVAFLTQPAPHFSVPVSSLYYHITISEGINIIEPFPYIPRKLALLF